MLSRSLYRKVSRKLYLGYTLLELMVVLLISGVMMSFSCYIFTDLTRSDLELRQAARLDSELSVLMAQLSRQLQRAGYYQRTPEQSEPAMVTPEVWRLQPALWRLAEQQQAASAQSRPGGENAAPGQSGESEYSGGYDCLLFAYDFDHNGQYRSQAMTTSTLTAEGYGFRHDAEQGTVEIRKGEAGCDEGGWEDLTDSNSLEVRQLMFMLHTRTHPQRHSSAPLSEHSPEPANSPEPVNAIWQQHHSIHISLEARLRGSSRWQQLEQWITLANTELVAVGLNATGGER